MRSAAIQNPGLVPLQKIRLPEPGGKILVAVSGGVDSMVLLHILKTLSGPQRWKLVVAHFNHRLRGRASDADEALVRKTAATMKLPFTSESADVEKFAKGSKLSIEMAARKLRHEFFVKAARERKIKTVALAHHADDQVELFFLRLLRGAGGGLAGMKWRSPSPADSKIALVRPLLGVSKAALEQFARENKIRYREDATNLSPDILRNRIRHELLPLLRRNYQPALNKAILRLLDVVGGESDFVGEIARSWSRGKGRGFEKLPLAIQRQTLKLQLAELGIGADFDLIESLRQTANQLVSVVGNFSVARDARGRVRLREQQGRKFDDTQLVVETNKPGTASFERTRFKWQFRAYTKSQIIGRAGVEYFNADKMGSETILRHWRAGDRFQPIGMKASVKLQDLFTNQKIPRDKRHKLVVAESGGEIFWVQGLRISENFKLMPQTKRMLVWRWWRSSLA